MDNCNIFQDCDSGVVKEYLDVGKGSLEEPLTLKLYQSTTAGNPAKGIAKTFVYNYLPTTAIVSSVSQNDVVLSGGIYQLGDIQVQLRILLKEIDDATQSPGDRILWRGHEYRIVGRVSTNYMGKYVLYEYTFRRI